MTWNIGARRVNRPKVAKAKGMTIFILSPVFSLLLIRRTNYGFVTNTAFYRKPYKAGGWHFLNAHNKSSMLRVEPLESRFPNGQFWIRSGNPRHIHKHCQRNVGFGQWTNVVKAAHWWWYLFVYPDLTSREQIKAQRHDSTFLIERCNTF